ncbi:MAG: biotin synthase BioB [Spirochaetes bacterium GWF1_51_8]|nr:MAG: biotin synthase BioB [Spirochaetes bacterium GWF1_51_8]
MGILHPAIEKAYGVLDGAPVDKELAGELMRLEGAPIIDLASLAHKVRLKFSPSRHICTIMNAKSGRCSQDCGYCSQSSFSETQAPVFPLVSEDEIFRAAENAYENDIACFCIVTSGLGYTEVTPEFEKILSAIDRVKFRYPARNLGASLGVLSPETARLLALHGVAFYNHNLQVNPSRYRELVASTHSIGDRIATVRYANDAGITACAGGIIGLGETADDRIELAFALRELKAKIIPLNVLVPVKGTPLEHTPPPAAADTLKAFALMRLVNPRAVIKFAAGRETVMKDFQGLLMLAGANGFLTGGYLTTRGRDAEDDENFLRELTVFGNL